MHSRKRTALAVAQAMTYLAMAGCGGGNVSTTTDSQSPQSADGRTRAQILAASTSPNGSTISQWSGGSLTDSSGNIWRLNGPGTSVGPGVTVNSVYADQGAEQLTIVDGLIWAQHPAGDWFTLLAPGTATPRTSGPRLNLPLPLPHPHLRCPFRATARQSRNGLAVLWSTAREISGVSTDPVPASGQVSPSMASTPVRARNC
jgi:hypothetical protein